MGLLVKFLINLLKSPFSHFFGTIALVSGLVSLLGIDLTSISNWGWIVATGFAVVSVELLIKENKKPSDEEGKIYEAAYVVTSDDRMYDEMYLGRDSIVSSANEFLYVTGSRSKNPQYLEAIEKKLEERRDLRHVRILIGVPRYDIMVAHLRKVASLCAARPRKDGRRSFEVGYFNLGDRAAERFIVCSEKRLLISLPSFRTALGYDTALIVDDPSVARRVGDLIATMAQAADVRCDSCDSLEELINGWPQENREAVSG